MTSMKKPEGRLAILLPGLGAVATTLIAGVGLIRRGKARPVGSLTQMGTARLGLRTENRVVPIRDLVPLASLDQVVFGAWDAVSEDGEQVARRSRVLGPADLEASGEMLRAIRPRPAVFDAARVPRIHANNLCPATTHRERVAALRQDIRDFKRDLEADRAVVIFMASVETLAPAPACAASLVQFEAGLDRSDPGISPTMLYAYAALREGAPFVNGTPNLSVELPALQALARELGVPIAGKDFKSGQTMMKTVLAPMLKARQLGLAGWFSTNILGNRDGEVLDEPQAFKSKEVTKAGVLDTILQPELYPDLYGNFAHKVAIHYYPPRGDDKEGWDNIDIFGWLHYPMQIKVNFLCKDSILAAPLALDLALFMDLAARLGWKGIQEWLSYYFKGPMVAEGLQPEHDLFIQLAKLKNTLRAIAGELPITHLGLEYYGDDLPLPNR
jgi:myo-inositol-1-phosphate synthase